MAHRHLGLMIEDSFPLYADSQYGHFDEQSSISYKEISEQQSNQPFDENKSTDSINESRKKIKKASIAQNALFRQLATKRIVKTFAGETKNLPKNLCRAIKGFIEGLFTQ
mgnify:CR=1 FL=1